MCSSSNLNCEHCLLRDSFQILLLILNEFKRILTSTPLENGGIEAN